MVVPGLDSSTSSSGAHTLGCSAGQSGCRSTITVLVRAPRLRGSILAGGCPERRGRAMTQSGLWLQEEGGAKDGGERVLWAIWSPASDAAFQQDDLGQMTSPLCASVSSPVR